MYYEKLRDKNSLDLINYEILDCSSHASSYLPSNIKKNDPLDPNSRWSTVTNDHRQFIILSCPESVVGTITFGKFSKIHVCNIKEMKISVSYDNVEYKEVFYGGLRNDTEPETFNLVTNLPLITRYFKIEPLAAWGMIFNYSIWYVELRGILNVKELVAANKLRQREELLRGCLRTLKKYGFKEEYNSLSLKVEPHNPILSKIKSLLDNERFEDCEAFLLSLDASLFDGYVTRSGYVVEWKEVEKKDMWPCERGGHQMVTVGDKVYLYGGWNGIEELGDFWSYDGREWICIIPDYLSSDDLSPVGPGKRSCHKMTTDGFKIYLLGKYVSTITRESKPIDNDIWVYDGGWKIIPTLGQDVPSNTYDHYVTYGNGALYCFGGKQTNDEELYGGMYKISLDEARGRWSTIRDDTKNEYGTPNLRGRLGHSMVYILNGRYSNSMAIVGGQRGKENFKELQIYDIETDTVYETIPFPLKTEGRIIQRAVLHNDELVVLFTFGKEKDSKLDAFAIYTYSLIDFKWREVCVKGDCPIPRSAHQFVPFKGDFLLFGGNVIDKTDKRQNDLWKLSLRRLRQEDVTETIQFTIRKHKFLSLLNKNKLREAVEYLRMFVKPLVTSEEKEEKFEKLCYEFYDRKDDNDAFEEIGKFIEK